MPQKKEPLSTVCYIAAADTARAKKEFKTVLNFAYYRLGMAGVLDDSVYERCIDDFDSGVLDGDSLVFTEQTPDRRSQQIAIYADRLDTESLNDDLDPEGARPGVETCTTEVANLSVDHPDLVVARPDRLLDSDGGLDWIRGLVDNGVTVHFASQGLTLHGDADITGGVMRALTLLCDVSDADVDVTETIKHQGGRPPLGFTSEDGELVPADDYEKICAVLQNVRFDRISKRSAAAKIGCSRQTVTAALDRPQLYSLDR